MVTTDCNESLKGYYALQSKVKQISNNSSLLLWIIRCKLRKLEEQCSVLGEEDEQ